MKQAIFKQAVQVETNEDVHKTLVGALRGITQGLKEIGVPNTTIIASLSYAFCQVVEDSWEGNPDPVVAIDKTELFLQSMAFGYSTLRKGQKNREGQH